MNANEIAPKANPRLNRIRAVSRIAKYVCFVFFAFSIGMSVSFALHSAKFKPDVGQYFLASLFDAIVCIWYWKLTRLFRFYEQGLIFAAGTIRCIKTLGVLCVIGGIVTSVLHFLPRYLPPTSAPLPPGVTVTRTVHSFHMSLFSFDFGTGIDFGVLLAGAIIVLIAWIMDEGRKIQEEQELTV
jgi:hypothetical protein